VVNRAPHGFIFLFVINKLRIDNEILHLHLRVDVPDGRYTLVPEGGDKCADEELQCMDVAQDLDQVQKGPRPTLQSKTSPGSLILFFKIMHLCFAMIVHLRFRS
jgi:hypothetical protein